MSKKLFKSQASSSRASSGIFGAQDTGSGHGFLGFTPAFGAIASSPLTYIYEPPDLSSISEPNVVVSLKNLQKKDSTTKSRALEDLQNYVSRLESDTAGVEEDILEAWIKIYPRTSIDSARRVRQLAHTLQGQLSISCGKRIAKYMSQIAGPWLAGLFDNDKSVVRAAQESLKQVFTSEEKMRGVWRVYQTPILQYAADIITKENKFSISDERTTSPDDASSKFARVIGSAILMVTNIIDELSTVDLEKQQTLFYDFFNQRTLWDFAVNPDPFVRRALYKLVASATLKQIDRLNVSTLSEVMLKTSLSISQTGSSLEWVKTVALLTSQWPHIWTDSSNITGKKSPSKRLFQFLRHGSQGGSSEYWVQVAALLASIPSSILLYGSEYAPNNIEGPAQPKFLVLEALHDGITNRDEPRANQTAAWDAYLGTANCIGSPLQHQSIRDTLAKYSLLPIVKQYVRPSSSESSWTILSSEKQIISVRAFRLTLDTSTSIFHEGWHQLSKDLVEDIRTSVPEQSKDYKISHDNLSANIGRWYSLQAAILELEDSNELEALIAETVTSELRTAVSVLRERDGKPYSAAALLENAIMSLPQIIRNNGEINTLFTDFANRDIPKLLLSPSAPHLIGTLSLLKDAVDTGPICEAGIRNLNAKPESSAKYSALQSLISSSFLAQSAEIEGLTSLIKENLNMALNGDKDRWNLVSAAMSNPAAPSELINDLLGSMVDLLSMDEEVLLSLHGLQLVNERNGQVLKAFSRSKNGSNLFSKLLFLTESPDFDISQKALKLSAALDTTTSHNAESSHAVASMIEIINQGIDTAEPSSLSVDSLVGQAAKLLNQAAEQDKSALTTALLPNSIQWTTAIEPFYFWSPNKSMAITDPLGGALTMIDQTIKSNAEVPSISRDSFGYSSALRMTWYVLGIVKTTDAYNIVTEDERILLHKNTALVTQLATHNLSIPGSIPLWHNLDAQVEPEIIDFITDIHSLLASWVQDEQAKGSQIPKKLRQQLFEGSRGVSTASYYSGCAFSRWTSNFVETQEDYNLLKEIGSLSSILKSPDMIATAAVLRSASKSKNLLRLCNELLSNLTRHDFQNGNEDGLRQLVLLNCIFYGRKDLLIEIPQQRLVFFVKHVVSQISKGIPSKPVKTEILTALRVLLPPIKDIYDNFWAKIIDFVVESWSFQKHIGDDSIPILYASLRLYQTLKRLGSSESNDDLQDNLKEKQELIMEGLLGLLKQVQEISDKYHDPRKIVNELLARQIDGFSEHIGSPGDLYPAIASESLPLQLSAYKILHHHIPVAQEQISLDRALEKDFVAKIPAALLSLILVAPSLNDHTEAGFERTLPTALNSYLLSWKLIFDHWTNSSYKVKGDYIACIKDGNYLSDLLFFTFDILITSRSKPVNASQFIIESYDPDTDNTSEKEIHKLLIHLYYLSLRCLPNLSKIWWRDTTTRQNNIAIESWTEKYISPLIIASELHAVNEWALAQPATDDQPLQIKVSLPARELTASIPVDEQTMSIAIRLPPSYPLSRATVESQHRVAVDEKKWRGWLIATQGVINFADAGSSGSAGGGGGGSPLIDGLIAWRRNVTAMLKGQTECAICYSVVAPDRQLPTKRCGTCRNCFHGSCLFRWFKSSNSSSCPLCRNAFHYG